MSGVSHVTWTALFCKLCLLLQAEPVSDTCNIVISVAEHGPCCIVHRVKSASGELCSRIQNTCLCFGRT
jgi:hypothetical protein